jgi:Glu-tRNA(Gln) amidotransferase subunit E-like FAD-binding protein
LKGELKQKGLSEEMIRLVLDSGMINEYENLLGVYYNPNFVAKVMLVLPKEIASHEKLSAEKAEEILNLDLLEEVLKKVADKSINENDVKHVLEEIVKGKTLGDALKIEKIDLSEIEGEIAKIVKEKPGLNANAYMGLAMAKFKGKVSGKEIMSILNKLVK